MNPLKKLTKLEHIIFIGNPCTENIKNFRLFLINELPSLQLIDFAKVTPEV